MSQNEARGVLETFWRNLYLRGTMLYDPDGTYGAIAYKQPTTNVPASRAWVIGPDQTIVLTQLGHDPDDVIGTIHALLADIHLPGDFDDDGNVDLDDVSQFDACFSGPDNPVGPGCAPGDLDGDTDVDCFDWYELVLAWTEGGTPPGTAHCTAHTVLSLTRSTLDWGEIAGASGYDVVTGDLELLRDTAGNFGAAVTGCAADDHGPSSLPHAGSPPAGEAVWFLVRGVTVAGSLSYDSSTDTARDDGLDGAVSACP